MPADSSLGLSQILSSEMLNQVVSILQQMTTAIAEESLVITEASLPPEACLSGEIARFVVILSRQFSGLLQAKALPESPDPGSFVLSAAASYQVELTFSPQAIAQFLTQLSQLFPAKSAIQTDLHQASQRLQPNHPELQSQFTGHLLGLLAATSTTSLSPDATSCAPIVVMALQQQFEQERLLNQVTNQIRQSMDLPVILQTAIDQIRLLLQVDRVVIYEFNQVALTSVPPPCLSLSGLRSHHLRSQSN